MTSKVKQKGYVYVLKSVDLYKIGHTSARWSIPLTYVKPLSPERIQKGIESDLHRRIQIYKTHNPHGIELIGKAMVNECKSEEAKMHEMLSSYRVTGEWYRLPDSVVKKLLTYLNSL